MIHSKTEKALVTLGTLAVFLYVEIKSGSFGNSVFDQIQNHILSGISSLTEQIEDSVEVILTVASFFFLLTVASPIRIFLPRYLEMRTGTPYHETESLVDFSRLGKITHTIKNGHFRLTSGQTSGKNFTGKFFGNFYCTKICVLIFQEESLGISFLYGDP